MAVEAKTKRIAESASLKNVRIKADEVVIDADARLENVTVNAKRFFVGKKSALNNTILLSSGDIVIGKLVQVKEESVLKAFKGVRVGDYTLIDRGVIVGGMESEKSRFEVGSRCVVLHHTYINIAREVIIGDNVGIGGYCMIFTHGVWQNAFRGYPVQFGKVEIKEDAWLPWHVFVMPGVTIGRGATIAGGSVVTQDIPDYCLAGGVPAKVIKSTGYPAQPSSQEKDQLAQTILRDFEGYVKGYLRNPSVASRTLGDAILLVSKDGSLVYSKSITPQLLESKDFRSLGDIAVASFKVPEALRKNHGWIEIDTERRSSELNKLAEEFAAFIRRYGVRVIEEE
jgi:serine acetyltransferase